MHKGKLLGLGLFAVLSLLVSSQLFAQEVQKVTITVGETSKTEFTLTPKEVTLKPGKVLFTLINKGTINHNITIKPKDKDVRLARAEVGKSETSEPIDLTAGEYEIYCSFTSGGNHKDKGMHGKLIVK
jgi:plastocyanin